jgi:hypothetical protein
MLPYIDLGLTNSIDIFIVNMNHCLNRIASTTFQRIKGKNIHKILLDNNILSQSTIQIDIDSMKMIPETIDECMVMSQPLPRNR